MISLHIDEQRGWRGGEQQVSYLVRGLAERGHTPIIAGRPNSEFMRRDHGVPDLIRVTAPFCGEADIYTSWRLSRVIRKHAVDIIHAHTSHALFHACVARLLAGRGHIVVTRRVDFAPAVNFLTRWKYAKPERIIAISDRIATVLRAYGVDDSKIRLVHSGQDPQRFEVEPIDRTALGIQPDEPILLCAAALVGHKDHMTLLNAMPVILATAPTVKLLLAGEGALRPQLEQQVSRLGIEKSVLFLGYRNDIPALLRAADVFVLSSKMEGLGSVLLEAMFCHVPIVACAGGGIPELVRHEETGLLAAPGDSEALANAIMRVLETPSLAESLVEGALRFAHKHGTVQTMIEGNVKVYNETLNFA